jgi:hypothetical protein
VSCSARQDKGGSFEIWFGGQCEGPAHVEGTVTEFDPPWVLQCGSLRFELNRDGNGCLLKFTDILHFEGPRTEEEIVNSVLGGWHRFLDALEHALEGLPVVHDKPEVDCSTIRLVGR